MDGDSNLRSPESTAYTSLLESGPSSGSRPYRDLGRYISATRLERSRYTRAELAKLLNVSTAAVVAYEQGATRPSFAKVRALAEYLRLNSSERDHLFALAGYDAREASPPGTLPIVTPATGLLTLMATLAPLPCHVSNQRWQFLAWNRASEVIFRFTLDDQDPVPGMTIVSPDHLNPLYLVHHPAYHFRERLGDAAWRRVSEIQMAWFRHEVAPFEGEPWLSALINDLDQVTGGTIRTLWEETAKVFQPDDYVIPLDTQTQLGRLTLRSTIIRLATTEEYMLVAYLPQTSHDAEIVQKIAALFPEIGKGQAIISLADVEIGAVPPGTIIRRPRM